MCGATFRVLLQRGFSRAYLRALIHVDEQQSKLALVALRSEILQPKRPGKSRCKTAVRMVITSVLITSQVRNESVCAALKRPMNPAFVVYHL